MGELPGAGAPGKGELNWALLAAVAVAVAAAARLVALGMGREGASFQLPVSLR